jgi:hypothetical protein
MIWYIIFSMVVLRVHVRQDCSNRRISCSILNLSKLLNKNDGVYEIFLLRVK